MLDLAYVLLVIFIIMTTATVQGIKVNLPKASAQPSLAEACRELFVRIVKQAFSQRRKMMLKLLKLRWPNAALDDAFTQSGLSPQIRAESVSLEQFIRLAETLAANSPDGRRDLRCRQ